MENYLSGTLRWQEMLALAKNINVNGGIKEMNKENIKNLSKFRFKLTGGALSGLNKENIRM